ncbi:ubiquinol-cytochrome c reductase cytochrome b subunit [Sporichthya sp.]|uniref:cytochrome bc1 complex cytochrome b subunit n=1 Tax=Sporichthya sp. TaxID=65475 RepID=UPI00179BBD78|nr:ubiquinol-cytochrome c reductase cytochrome b subunit [Sporichthya sp.]MBA3744650.1 ubiquinol-cytochrome c reductase cytochrome b subunit [Sporichthya sp.]
MAVANAPGGAATYLDERLGTNAAARKNLRKVFPEHWSFMLGEIVLYSFIILLATGVYLTLFFKPSMQEVAYDGSYLPLQGVQMSEAYASTLDISFEVRGGLLVRQIHHWSALIFVAGIVLHLLRVFFTGAFRKPRELNWLIGVTLFVLALLEGFAGYSLPDDLLSGTGLRIAEAIMLSIPVVGTYVQFFVFGGEFPGEDIIPRLYVAHVLLIPGIILALIAVHLMLVVVHKHTQFPGPGRTNDNVVGFPLMPVYMAKAGGFFFIVAGVCALLGGLAQINPVWFFGPYYPDQISAGSQPDWYIGFLDGLVRVMPNWETNLAGHSVSWNLLLAGLAVPGVMFTLLALYPFVEAWVTGDRREHHLLDRPRDAPVRTALGAMSLAFYLLLVLNGGNDIIAYTFGLSINTITRTVQVALFVLPPIVFALTKRACLGLQRRERERILHGRETGTIKRLPSGEFIEVHAPISAQERFTLMARQTYQPISARAATDENGIPARGGRRRSRLSRFWFADTVPKPTAEELHANGHANGQANGQAELSHGDEPTELAGQQ